jgi:putative sterol carrier protein
MQGICYNPQSKDIYWKTVVCYKGSCMNQEIQVILEQLIGAFRPERAKGIDAVIQIELIGEGSYVMTIRDQKLDLKPGKAAGARITLQAMTSDLQEIFLHKLDPAAAFFQGRLTVSGDMGLALKLPGLFQ